MILHVTVHSSKAQETVAFYQWLLDLPVTETVKTPSGEIVFLGGGETKLEIIPDVQAEEIQVKSLSIGFAVNCLEQKIEMLQGKGIACSPVISPSPVIRFVFFTDLNGCQIQLCEQKK